MRSPRSPSTSPSAPWSSSWRPLVASPWCSASSAGASPSRAPPAATRASSSASPAWTTTPPSSAPIPGPAPSPRSAPSAWTASTASGPSSGPIASRCRTPSTRTASRVGWPTRRLARCAAPTSRWAPTPSEGEPGARARSRAHRRPPVGRRAAPGAEYASGTCVSLCRTAARPSSRAGADHDPEAVSPSSHVRAATGAVVH
mmetsp:Transcript_54984/g.152277  ORF Transcript_54984/g.152277 Transcript_54984/m.152277 type:complete len:201 (+) Transcript_54984:520-1122(+)